MEEKRERICPVCGEDLRPVGLIYIVVSHEVDEEKEEIYEQLWHKGCYLEYAQRQAARRQEMTL